MAIILLKIVLNTILKQARYFMEAVKAITSMTPGLCFSALKVCPITKDNMPWCPCPIKNEATGLLNHFCMLEVLFIYLAFEKDSGTVLEK